MRLVINALPLLGEESGIGNYTRHIAAAVLSEPERFDVTFFYGYTSKKLLAAPATQSATLLSHLKSLARKNDVVLAMAKKALAVANAVRHTLYPQQWDCYFEPNFVFLPTLEARSAVMTLHDFSCFRYPQWHPQDRVAHMEKFLAQSVERATLIITAAESIREEAESSYGIARERMAVIPHGVDTGIFRPASQQDIQAIKVKYNLPEHFILHVGAIEPRKNLTNLIHAHALLPPALRKQFPLLLIGPKGWNNAEILSAIEKAGPNVRLLGHVPLEDLAAFYSAAELFVYPSWYEGFGLPVLEAMACGRPVLASTASALVELCQGCATHVPPEDVDTMAKTLVELLEDPGLRAQKGKLALTRAKDFSWEKAASAHMRIFSQLPC